MRFRLKTLLLAVAFIALILCAITYWDAIPGTYYRDGNGFPHGTGQAECLYDDGSLMIREWYSRGLIYKATWFKPDGTEIATETYDKASGGIGYYLRQDGSIKSKYTYEYSPDDQLYVSAGVPVYYDRKGNPVPDATEPIE
jgi:hypothetical protein